MREALDGRAVESLAVVIGRILLQRRGVRIAQRGERVSAGLADEEVVAVELLGLVALGGVVARLGLAGLPQQRGLVLREEVELTLDEVGEAAAAEDQSSSS